MLICVAYRQVCSGTTGHAEAVKLSYTPGGVGYGELVEFFYRTHDPTTVDRQGPDTGSRQSSLGTQSLRLDSGTDSV